MVIGKNGDIPPPATSLAEPETRVVEASTVEKLDVTVWQSRPRHRWDRID
jgi:hypothetical protein